MLVVKMAVYKIMERYLEKTTVSGHKFTPGQVIVWL